MTKNSRDEIREAYKIEQQKSEKKVKAITYSIASLVALVLVGLIVSLIVVGNDKNDTGNPIVNNAAQVVPATPDENGAFVVKSDKTTENSKRVDVFFDPMCPGCGIVDRAISKTLAEMVDSGEIELYLSPVSFLDEASSDNYSTRAVSAFIAVAEEDSRKALDFMSGIFAKEFQPREGNAYESVTNEDFADVALAVGSSTSVVDSIKSGSAYSDWIAENSTKQLARKDLFPDGFSTPSVFTNVSYKNGIATGEKVVFVSGGILESFVEAVRGS